MQSGFRTKMSLRRNENGNVNYTPEEKVIAAKLAGPDVDEEWADRHVASVIREIHSYWTTSEFERRERREEGVELREVSRIDFRSCGLRIA